MITRVKNIAASESVVVLRTLNRFPVSHGEVTDLSRTDGHKRITTQTEIKDLIRRGLLEEVNG